VHGTDGVDSQTCGGELTPCQSFPYAIDNIASFEMQVRLYRDDEPYVLNEPYELCPYKDFDVGGISELVDGELIHPVVLYDFLYDYLLLYTAEKVYKFGNLTFAVDATYSSSYFSYGGNILYEETGSYVSSVTFEYDFCFYFFY
jgi:hypothetical protein